MAAPIGRDLATSRRHRRLGSVVRRRVASMTAGERAEFDLTYDAEKASLEGEEEPDARRGG